MSKSQPSGNLTTDFIDEKTLYTLGGASLGVLLICWVIGYIAVDASWLNYKFFRILGFVLSEAFAIYIFFWKRRKKSMRWLLAFLNGLIIFVNASGLNSMTASYIFNPRDTSSAKLASHAFEAQKNSTRFTEAAIIPLPRMVNWWPDEKLVTKTQELVVSNQELQAANVQMKRIIDEISTGNINSGNVQLDLLKAELLTKEEEINRLRGSLGQGDKASQDEIRRLNDSLRVYRNKYASSGKGIGSLKSELANCLSEKSSLQDNLNTLNSQITELKNALATCKNEKPQPTKTKDLSGLVAQLQNSLNTCLKEKMALEQGGDNNSSKMAELQNALNTCNKDRYAAQQEIKNLRSQLAGMKKDGNTGQSGNSMSALLSMLCSKATSKGPQTAEDLKLRSNKQLFSQIIALCKQYNLYQNPVE